MNNPLLKEIVWSKGRAKAEMSKQTSWSSSKDWSGLSGLEIDGYTFNNLLFSWKYSPVDPVFALAYVYIIPRTYRLECIRQHRHTRC